MKVTKIRKVRYGLLELQINNVVAFAVSNEVLQKFKVTEGIALKPAEIVRMKYTEDYRRLYDYASALLDQRDYSRQMLIQKLVRSGRVEISENFEIPDKTEELSIKIADKFVSSGFVDDSKYAQMLFRDLVSVRNYGIDRVRAALRSKGIDPEIIRNTIADNQPDEMETIDKIKKIIEQKYIRKLSEKGGKEKMFAALIRRGFNYNHIKSAVNCFDFEN